MESSTPSTARPSRAVNAVAAVPMSCTPPALPGHRTLLAIGSRVSRLNSIPEGKWAEPPAFDDACSLLRAGDAHADDGRWPTAAPVQLDAMQRPCAVVPTGHERRNRRFFRYTT